MTPHQYLKLYRYDERLVNGAFFPATPLRIKSGDRVGVVLFSTGGPYKRNEVAPFLHNLFMDPAILDLPFGHWARPWLSRLMAGRRARMLRDKYEAIGGNSPLNRLTREQAQSLEAMLNRKVGAPSDILFRVYIGMRYWRPTSEEVATEMQKEGINKVLLLPMYPQYSKSSTGSSLMYWWHLQESGAIPHWPTTYVYEYADYPKYIQALSERIDEALQRFPRRVREKVHLIFSAHGLPVREAREHKDPYSRYIHNTVRAVMAYRGQDHPYHVAYQGKFGFSHWLAPSLEEQLKNIAHSSHNAVLVVPVSFVSDHLETAYVLDVQTREEAENLGIVHFEVTSGLNCHPLFIEALAEIAMDRLNLENGGSQVPPSGDGMTSGVSLPLRRPRSS